MDIEDIIKENSILKQENNLLKEHLKNIQHQPVVKLIMKIIKKNY